MALLANNYRLKRMENIRAYPEYCELYQMGKMILLNGRNLFLLQQEDQEWLLKHPRPSCIIFDFGGELDCHSFHTYMFTIHQQKIIYIYKPGNRI